MYLSKYGTARHIYIAIPKAGSANHAVSADWTPAAGDVKISKDGGAAANVTNLPTAIAMGNSTIWDFAHRDGDAGSADHRDGLRLGDQGGRRHGVQHRGPTATPARSMWWTCPMACELQPDGAAQRAAEAAGRLYTRSTGAGQIAGRQWKCPGEPGHHQEQIRW